MRVRHTRISDFLVDAMAISIGVLTPRRPDAFAAALSGPIAAPCPGQH
jgi:hypothetical protein